MSRFVKAKTMATTMPLLISTPLVYRLALGVHLIEPSLLLRNRDPLHRINAIYGVKSMKTVALAQPTGPQVNNIGWIRTSNSSSAPQILLPTGCLIVAG